MDFTKFVALLDSKSLYFCRADKLGDPFEGTLPRIRSQAYRHSLQAGTGATTSEKLREAEIEDFDFRRRQRLCTGVNCWHMNRTESAGMWRLYAKSNEAVAITTTATSLAQQFDDLAHIGAVQYVDYAAEGYDESNILAPFFHKRLSFAHESEVRVVLQAFSTDENGFAFVDEEVLSEDGGFDHPIKLEDVIHSVHVAPTSPTWYFKLVERVCEQYELNAPVHRSELDAEPLK